MKTKRNLLSVCLFCLSFTACINAETKPRLEEFNIIDGDIEKVSYQVEVARDNASRRRGLMYRKELSPNRGMVLDYKHSRKVAIWMKNTYIPLDIIFIDKTGIIVNIHEGAEPLSIKTIESAGEVRTVLEINAGQVEQYGIKVGDQVRHASFGTR